MAAMAALMGGSGAGAGGLGGLFGMAPPGLAPAADPEVAYATQLQQLADMGFFDRQSNIAALQVCVGVSWGQAPGSTAGHGGLR